MVRLLVFSLPSPRPRTLNYHLELPTELVGFLEILPWAFKEEPNYKT